MCTSTSCSSQVPTSTTRTPSRSAASVRTLWRGDHRARGGTVAEPPVDVDYVVQLQEWLNRMGSPIRNDHGRSAAELLHDQRQGLSGDRHHSRARGQRIKFRIIGTNNNFIHRCTCTAGRSASWRATGYRSARRASTPTSSTSDRDSGTTSSGPHVSRANGSSTATSRTTR